MLEIKEIKEINEVDEIQNTLYLEMLPIYQEFVVKMNKVMAQYGLIIKEIPAPIFGEK
jgi:hypothetical protein